MNGVLYYIWKNRLLDNIKLHTTDGKSLDIIDYGTWNGIDNIVNNTKIRIDNQIWSGDIVLHNKSSEPEERIDRKDGSYSNVILHVSMNGDYKATGEHCEAAHQLNIECADSLNEEYEAMEQHISKLPCGKAIREIENVVLHSILSRLLVERIEEKSTTIGELLTECSMKWDDALFKTIARSFGFGIQSNVFGKWASILDMQALARHRDNIMQTEAIMFGQAGLLDEQSIPYYYRDSASRSDYFQEISKEYRYLSKKFSLECMDHRSWGTSNATPHLRIARLASIYNRNRTNMGSITACNTINELRELLNAPLDGYWRNHTCFGGTETCGNGAIKERHCDIIIMNAIVPTLFIYGKRHANMALCNRAEDYMYLMKGEENSIIRRWKEEGVKVECAADSQALLQLSKKYCSVCNCKNCYFAYHYIKRGLAI